MSNFITDKQWAQYEREGYLKLGKLVSDSELKALQQRIDDIMLGKANVDYDRMMMQLDTDSGKYEDAPAQTRGFKGPTLNYRKIQELEFDPLFLAYMKRPVFKEICARVYGPDTPVAAFRAMFMNKPARKGTLLPWHQDRWLALDRDPLITVWTALDPATVANGCVQVIPGSHKLGILNPTHHSAFLTDEQAKQHAPKDKIVFLELKAGEVALLHNWLLHSSDKNNTDIPRRAFSVSYMDARTVSKNGEKFSVIFGRGALELQEMARA
ncbi:MAG: phytanoyl-CoA dioxygenase family protein [Chloroflexi bacterium]|nr:phytanoyl-CoA dioxygenase family protein [Chloroflexota bacterium]